MKIGDILLWAAAALAPCLSFAASDANTYVTVESSTTGVEGIYAVGDDFYVTTRGVCSPPFAAEIEITANSPWHLKEPISQQLRLAIGESGEYMVDDGSGVEEGPNGDIYVLKLDIEQSETNVCWKSASCTLNLTDDSYTGGGVEWTSGPTGISGRGRSITFNPSLLDPGEYVVTARTDVAKAYFDTCVVRVIYVTELQHKIGNSANWHRFNGPRKILYGKNSQIKAELIPDINGAGNNLHWDGSYGASGVGKVIGHVYRSVPSDSDDDLKSIYTDSGPDVPENFIVCDSVVGIHSNVASDSALTNGHAWVSLSVYGAAGVFTTTYGLWGNIPQAQTGTDVHVNIEPPTGGMYRRYYLLSPSQYDNLMNFLRKPAKWGYFYTCADWARDAYLSATGEEISASDYVFGTPRAVSGSIIEKEQNAATSIDSPYDGGEEPPPTSDSSSSGGWAGDSFPSSL